MEKSLRFRFPGGSRRCFRIKPAAAAAGRLELELEGGGKLRQIVIPGRLIVRASTAPPPGFSAGDGGKGREL